jgi:hypothetical protein
MSERNQQLQEILHHISRIETELRLLREVVRDLVSDEEEGDQSLILVDAELVIPEEALDPHRQAPQEPRVIAPETSRTLTRSELRQEARWRAQNWAIRERQARTEREALEQLGRAARQNRN